MTSSLNPLAEKAISENIDQEELQKVATLKPGMTWTDFEQAFLRGMTSSGPGMDFEAVVACVAIHLKDVVESTTLLDDDF